MLHYPLVPQIGLQGLITQGPPTLWLQDGFGQQGALAGDRKEGESEVSSSLLPPSGPHPCSLSGGHCKLAVTLNPSLSSGQGPSSCPRCLQVLATVPSPPLNCALTQQPQGHVPGAPALSLELPCTCHTFLKVSWCGPQAQERCSKASVIRKMQIKTTMTYHVIPARSAVIPKNIK